MRHTYMHTYSNMHIAVCMPLQYVCLCIMLPLPHAICIFLHVCLCMRHTCSDANERHASYMPICILHETYIWHTYILLYAYVCMPHMYVCHMYVCLMQYAYCCMYASAIAVCNMHIAVCMPLHEAYMQQHKAEAYIQQYAYCMPGIHASYIQQYACLPQQCVCLFIILPAYILYACIHVALYFLFVCLPL